MATNIFARYVWLVDQLRKFRRLNLHGINALWKKSSLWDGSEISKRTFHNHRHAIEEIFDIEIKCDLDDEYRYYIADYEYLVNDSLRCWLLNSYATLHQIRADKSLRRRIRYENIPSGHLFLSDIIDAMRQNVAVEFDYRGFTNDKAHTIRLEPYCVCVHSRRWYVIGHSEAYNELRTFALDRMLTLTLTPQQFSMPEDFSIEQYFEGCCGILVDEKIPIQRVVIDVFDSARNYVATLPLHSSQREIGRTETTTTYEYHVRPDFNFIQRILEQVDRSEVIEPLSLRHQLKKISEHLLKCYTD